MKNKLSIVVIIVIALTGLLMYRQANRFELPKGETKAFNQKQTISNQQEKKDMKNNTTGTPKLSAEEKSTAKSVSAREILITDGVKHSIALDEIRQGCFGRDCIPSVDEPVFISVKEADEMLPEDTVGIGLEHNGEKRFYPFNMLVTREIVNDEIAGMPIVVTYCPLCGTGVVFERKIGGKTYEFGVSGMLWQSNLLMYNREDEESKISLWSQVLGEAVLGEATGTKLPIIQSDIVRYTDWSKANPKTKVLNTGRIGDPYGGDYYGVARSFKPDFDEEKSPLLPTAYVFGIEIGGKFKAYPSKLIAEGKTQDTFNGTELRIEKNKVGQVRIIDVGSGESLPVVSGFWFSWFAVHPETELFLKK